MEPKSFRQGLGPLLFIVFIFFFNTFSRSLLSPLLLDIETEFSISHTRSSQLFLFISLGHSTMMLFSGFVSSKIMHKGTIVLSSFGIAAGLFLIAVTPQMWMLQVLLVFLGLSAGLYPPSGMSAVTEMIRKEDWQKALSLHELGPHFAMAAVPLFAVLLKPWFSWRGVIGIAAGGVALAALFFNFFVHVGKHKGTAPTFSNIRPLLKLPSFWIMILFTGFALGSIQGIYLMIPTYLISEVGMDPVYTNTVFGISRFIPIAALLTAGLILDKIGIKRAMFILMALSGISIFLLGLLSGSWLTLIVFIQPAVGALLVPSSLAALSAIGPSDSRNIAFSMVLPFASLMGNGAFPSFLGYMGDHTSFSLGFIIIGVLMLILAGLTGFLRLNK
ncbi:MAG: MFS transporter [Spirochaetota bacterium]